MRLVEGHDRISDPGSEPGAQARLWRHVDGGSRGIRTSHQYVREAGAAARTMLIEAAANEWKVPPSECSVANSVIAHKASGRTTTYGKVAEAAAKLEPPKDIKLKDPKDWKIAGKGLKRLDTADKLVGKLIYGIDIKMAGLLVVATIKDSPVQTGKIKSFDAAKVTGMPGVKNVVQVGSSGVAVIADTYWHAHKAIEALPIVWDPGEPGKVSSASIAEFLKGGLDAEQAFVGNKAGDAKSAIRGAAQDFALK
jgi:isoquinoline 1-oxidoreductase beta subunit